MKLKVASKILDANERIANENTGILKSKGIFSINLMSSPGAGKTTLLEKTIIALSSKIKIAVIEGDVAGSDDAERIDKLHIPVIQINTGGGCHLDASMVQEAVNDLPLEGVKLLFIENVGNLVCPAAFNLGEDIKVMLLSMTEGHDKPLKYPNMFQTSSALVINKIDLAPYVNADIEKIKKDALSLNPSMKIFEVSCQTGEGVEKWTDWLLTLCS
ncbi:MAG: hydrogenase nickel incorporation protein HypB [Dissulfurispiraceae bacterium]|jgi:hydrogenase nickel incorporation protein HypB|nr:hydrogenase nickel incorporation protein HypB [Dissulfurispiraceae bacterium]